MTSLKTYPALALLALAACGGAKSDTAADTAATTDVQRAAAIANAVQAAPAKVDSILTANGLTTESLEQMMYVIAADSTKSAEYRRLTGR